MFWDTFCTLCQNVGKTPNGVCDELGFSNATATKWKKGSMPSSKSLQIIANYFGVSTDYLLTGNDTKKETPPSSDRWERFSDDFDTLSKESQDRILLNVQAMIDTEKKLRNKQ